MLALNHHKPIAGTLVQLDELEKLAHETGLRYSELTAEYQKRQNQETKPLYRHNPERFMKYFRWLYDETFARRIYQAELNGEAFDGPTFQAWLTNSMRELALPNRSPYLEQYNG